MLESVPIPRESSVCNVLCQWNTRVTITYRIYHINDMCDKRLPEYSWLDNLLMVKNKILNTVHKLY